MIIKGLIDEDFSNYKIPSMFIAFPYCSFKCCKEQNLPIKTCQNCELAQIKDIEVSVNNIVNRFLSNPITTSVVVGGMEPFDSWTDLELLINTFRQHTEVTIVIYSGYKEEEIQDKINKLKHYSNIIIKFGRYIPNQQPHFDEILGVQLASPNQYARKIS